MPVGVLFLLFGIYIVVVSFHYKKLIKTVLSGTKQNSDELAEADKTLSELHKVEEKKFEPMSDIGNMAETYAYKVADGAGVQFAAPDLSKIRAGDSMDNAIKVCPNCGDILLAKAERCPTCGKKAKDLPLIDKNNTEVIDAAVAQAPHPKATLKPKWQTNVEAFEEIWEKEAQPPFAPEQDGSPSAGPMVQRKSQLHCTRSALDDQGGSFEGDRRRVPDQGFCGVQHGWEAKSNNDVDAVHRHDGKTD